MILQGLLGPTIVGAKPYRHKKTGNTYFHICEATLEATGEKVVVYVGADEKVWVRPSDEFFDGRFEAL